MKKFLALLVVFTLMSCDELQNVVNNLPTDGGSILSNTDIGNGLKEALDKGIDKQVAKLTSTDGFYKNELVKILLPEELQKVDSGLRRVGLGSLADEGIKVLNRAAEDAVSEATPIFVSAVKELTFTDVKNILLGTDNAATTYLEGKTQTATASRTTNLLKQVFALQD